jgi:hypothetical protein
VGVGDSEKRIDSVGSSTAPQQIAENVLALRAAAALDIAVHRCGEG